MVGKVDVSIFTFIKMNSNYFENKLKETYEIFI